MFGEHPEKLIPGAQIDIVHFHSPKREAGDFTEKICYGPVQKQVRDALDYINTKLVVEKVVKHQNRPEEDRFFTYPLDACEEALVNSIFHKSYLIPEPVEVRIYTDEIKIVNYPGPDRSIDMKKFAQGKAISRRYKNRRIGEFLKEIDLSEKRSTGITKILDALAANGSPLPEFETNAERDYMVTTIKIHEGFEQSEILNAGAVNDGDDNAGRKNITSSDVINDVLNDGINAVERAVLQAIEGNVSITIPDIAKAIKKSQSTVDRAIRSLKIKKLLDRIESKKTGYWKIHKKD